MHVITVDPRDDDRWSYLARVPAAGLFHAPPWYRALGDCYGFEVRARVALDGDGRAVGGLAFVELDDLLGARIAALPFTDACDVLAPDRETWRAIVEPLLGGVRPVQLRCLDHRFAASEPRLVVTKRARWHRLVLDVDPERTWAGYDPAARRAIRKAERAGVEIRPLEGPGDLAEFHRLHVALRKRKYQLLAQPLAFFEAIQRHFTAAGGWYPLGAYQNGRLIAATVYLRWADVLYYKFNASAPASLDARPNDLLVKAGTELARELGCHAVDLGPSDDDQPGLIRFKLRFGAASGELRFLRYTPAGYADPRVEQARRLLTGLTRWLTLPEVPDDVTAAAGAELYRYFA